MRKIEIAISDSFFKIYFYTCLLGKGFLLVKCLGGQWDGQGSLQCLKGEGGGEKNHYKKWEPSYEE